MNNDLLLLKALSDESRLKIIKSMLNGEKCVCQIIPKLNVKQSTTSIHLKKLENAGIIKSRKEGKNVYYSIVNVKAINILKALGIATPKHSKKFCYLQKKVLKNKNKNKKNVNNK